MVTDAKRYVMKCEQCQKHIEVHIAPFIWTQHFRCVVEVLLVSHGYSGPFHIVSSVVNVSNYGCWLFHQVDQIKALAKITTTNIKKFFKKNSLAIY